MQQALRFSTFLGVLLSLGNVGCGGGTTGSGNQALGISASTKTINYGDSVTISWGGSGLQRIVQSGTNFPVPSSEVSGSVIDQPASDATYSIDAIDASGNDETASVTVKVRPSTKQFLVIGDQSVAGVPQTTQLIQAITATQVATSLTVPSPLTADVVVLLPSASMGSADQATITTYLQSGGRVILIAEAPAKLATGNANSSDISSIGSWFAGATKIQGYTGSNVVTTNPGLPLSTTLYGDTTGACDMVLPVSSTATLLEQASGQADPAFLYRPTIGGRVAYIARVGLGSSAIDASDNGVLAAICRWAADGP